MVMVYRGIGSEKTKPVLALALLLSCLLLPLVSSVPLSRSVSLGNNPLALDSSLEVPVHQGVARTAEERNMGGVAARMGIEVNDYPGSSANGRHDPPRSPGRA
uniref:Uncharacterized protein n=1 Tax=Avena sativa TaxID=4498 RepID=A0ACD5WIZ4_AVESA